MRGTAPPACIVANNMAAFLQAKDARCGQSRLDGQKEMQDARNSVVFSRICQGPALARGPLCISGPGNSHWRQVTASGDPSSVFKWRTSVVGQWGRGTTRGIACSEPFSDLERPCKASAATRQGKRFDGQLTALRGDLEGACGAVAHAAGKGQSANQLAVA